MLLDGQVRAWTGFPGLALYQNTILQYVISDRARYGYRALYYFAVKNCQGPEVDGILGPLPLSGRPRGHIRLPSNCINSTHISYF